MLLETEVAAAAHALVGGPVPHMQRTAADPKGEKLLRRLTAMTARSAAGFAPEVRLWSAPGAAVRVVALAG